MLRLLFMLNPANLLYELGTGRAIDNAARQRAETARDLAEVDALCERLCATATAGAESSERVRLAA
ncbi:MAG TPA: hypothetical protein VL119_03660 [Acidimicrobiia bacterium]|nr:hypothetical protein [Acidimicrobiia bacterium]